jgi:glycine oxidase
MKVLVRGAGVAGLTVAAELARRGAAVTVAERRPSLAGSASWFAGGMLAPWCERASAEQPVLDLGREAAGWWDAMLPGHVVRAGTLVVAPARDAGEVERFARRTSNGRRLDGDGIAALEPDLAGRFRTGLHFAQEAHLDPRRALQALQEKLAAQGAAFRFDTDARTLRGFDRIVDCTGMAVDDPAIRGVRGEMLILRTTDVRLSRPVRLLHPRIPLYIVPRDDGHFMVGATMIETDAAGPVTARSMMELLNAAYAVHPAFGEAAIVETGVGIRPAFADNLPRVTAAGAGIAVNGLYRHGFLLSPAMARRAADLVLDTSTLELADEADRQRRNA